MRKLKLSIIIGAECTILIPTIVWFFCQVFYGYISLDEFISTIVHPKWWMAYVLVYATIIYVFMNNKLKIIDIYLKNPNPDDLNKIYRSINVIPKFLMTAIVIFCTIGPSTYIIPQNYYTSKEFLLSNILAFAFIFSFAVPFFVFTMISVEKFTKNIPLSEESKFLSSNMKLAINMLATAFGTLLIIVVLNISTILENSNLRDLKHLENMLIQKNVVIGALCIVIIVSNFLILSRQLITPTNRVSLALKDMSQGEGDLTIKLETNSRDDIGELVKWFNQFVENTRNLIKITKHSVEKLNNSTITINNSYNSLCTSSIEVIKVVECVTKGTTSQAEELSSINIILQAFGQDIKNASNQLEIISSTAQLSASQARKDSKRLNDFMDRIHRMGVSFNAVYEKTKELSDGIHNINSITDIIQSVANQTNLLALNASIEAARAGEAGRGFSVVAEEIRKLAEQSKKFSEEIKKVVDKTFLETSYVMQKTEETNIDLNNQIKEISIAMESFIELINSINGMAPKIENTANILLDINGKKEEVFSKVSEVAAVSQETSASSEEILASTEVMNSELHSISKAFHELESLSNDLNEEINRFKV